MLRVGFQLGKTLSEVGRMSLVELALWEQWLKKNDPEKRFDMRFALLNCRLANLLSDQTWELDDFRYFRDDEETLKKTYGEDQWWEMMMGYKRGIESRTEGNG